MSNRLTQPIVAIWLILLSSVLMAKPQYVDYKPLADVVALKPGEVNDRNLKVPVITWGGRYCNDSREWKPVTKYP
ncbi:MAG: hypothetical protein H6999_04265 [Hahellaceae bacterium]|nr:hypothetical protein [Hahellaceae bacterium]